MTATVKVAVVDRLPRRCGECTLCCKVMPMHRDAYPPDEVADVVTKMIAAGVAQPKDFVGMTVDFDKAAGVKCPHQRHNGCAIYDKRPFGCRYWNCRWLTGDDTADMRRPDRAGFVVDIMPDFITIPNDSGKLVNVECVQIWADPKRPDAWRDDAALAAFLERRGAQGKVALIRANSQDAIVRFPGAMSSDGKPHEVPGKAGPDSHDHEARFEGLAKCRKAILEVPT